MFKILGIIIVVVGVVLSVNGIRALFGQIRMKENDRSARFYVGIRGLAGGLAAIFLGVTIYLTY